ncbi:MAG: hypothetical protein WBA02_16675 [Jannaschia helgolandensis]|jgi:hypothetical protein|uniref:hypothetical protein n=1 Tax=Jannaschia helgolandensis TaxID=188906 RepID=UPI003C74837C
MTITILSGARNRETRNAEQFRDALLASEPQLAHPDIVVYIMSNLALPGREIDLMMLYYDPRPSELQLKTTAGKAIHSFVLVLEVKQHSPDLIRFEGPRVLVRYDQLWSDATDQCDAQTYALKRYQEAPYRAHKRRQSTFVQRAIWLARAPSSAFSDRPAESSVPVHFSEIVWKGIVDGFVLNKYFNAVRTLVDNPQHAKHHSIDSLKETLTYVVRPTRLDLRRVNALTQTRFDAEKTAYIQNLGNGLLMLRGRGGTGKTFALVQVALHLARQGKKTTLLTYNHGLIADVNRAFRFIKEKEPSLEPLPVIETRYAFIQAVFEINFGRVAEKIVRRHIDEISDREKFRLWALVRPQEFLDSHIPGECTGEWNLRCPLCRRRQMHPGRPGQEEAEKLWRDVCGTPGSREMPFDFVLIDEGQDWTEGQRDFIFEVFGAGHVVVADGVDQFVGQDRCNWDRGDIPINRRHGLRSSRRTKAATCQTVAEIAHELDLPDWDLEPDPNTHGGRFTVIVEPDGRRAVELSLEILEADQREEHTLKAVDNLICMPSSKMAMGINYAALFDSAIEKAARDSWRGFDENDRRTYPVRESQLRAVQYSSCRGMEGWTTVCLALDAFFNFQLRHPRLNATELEASMRAEKGMFFSQSEFEEKLAQEARLFAVNWLMIPLTRSIDHLVVHIADDSSELCGILRAVSLRLPGSIEWINPNTVGAPLIPSK